LLVMMPKTLPHGAPVTIPISGNTKNSAASAARTASSGLNGPARGVVLAQPQGR